ncbi:MAG: toll/interleukin-1 receptor domain-containing protein [Devosia sp.]|uniref:toll/interleukin-1 receptor domain-containing protein n=1 Tax=Devosia sp. TaxID=1871048 RepID=UPI001A3F48ED|nr:toll/interleukin-1 receptor domain-containing protein [Devosia sp.]MBL8597374.1 toll/interleukin-1 receptor domain-containing protein [Devosia sp.]
MAKLFFSYSHADEGLRDQLEKHLTMLRRQGAIETWHDRRIAGGEDFATAIDQNLEDADVVLLLVSPDFLASEYCYEREMLRAIERHEKGSAVVIPVILRPCDWHGAPFGGLLAAPKDSKPVTQWPDLDAAFLDVVRIIKTALPKQAAQSPAISTPRGVTPAAIAEPRSSNLRLKKEFTERDRDRFQQEAFEFMAKFFENSLTELQSRNDGIEYDFRRIDLSRFVAAIYRNGKAEARCTIYVGGGFGGINYVHGETMADNTTNETLRVDADDQMMFLRTLGMARFGGKRDAKLSQEGAAELYWSLLIDRLQ